MAGHDADTVERALLLGAFGENLRALRERRNFLQETLARVARVHRTHIAALEGGLKEPRASMLLILADALENPPGALFAGTSVPRDRKPRTHSKGGRLEDLGTGAGITPQETGAAEPRGGDA